MSHNPPETFPKPFKCSRTFVLWFYSINTCSLLDIHHYIGVVLLRKVVRNECAGECVQEEKRDCETREKDAKRQTTRIEPVSDGMIHLQLCMDHVWRMPVVCDKFHEHKFCVKLSKSNVLISPRRNDHSKVSMPIHSSLGFVGFLGRLLQKHSSQAHSRS
jgi:hypothetical protein